MFEQQLTETHSRIANDHPMSAGRAAQLVSGTADMSSMPIDNRHVIIIGPISAAVRQTSYIIRVSQ